MSKFNYGEIVCTRVIDDRMKEDKEFTDFVNKSLNRHLNGDWGEMCVEDIVSNNEALICGDRLFSSYNYSNDEKVWIITESDRSHTTILFPSDY